MPVMTPEIRLEIEQEMKNLEIEVNETTKKLLMEKLNEQQLRAERYRTAILTVVKDDSIGEFLAALGTIITHTLKHTFTDPIELINETTKLITTLTYIIVEHIKQQKGEST